MDAASDCTAGRDTDGALVTGGVPPPSGDGEKGDAGQTLNGSHVVNAHASGSVAAPMGPVVTSGVSNDATSAPAVNSGVALSRKPPASNSVIQSTVTPAALSSSPVPTLNGGSEGPAVGGSPAPAGTLTQGASSAAGSASTEKVAAPAEAPAAHALSPQQQVPAGTINTPRGPAPTGQGGIQATSPQMLTPRLPQASPGQPSIHNIQIPPGMVLVRSESGQLLMIPQQALAQVQAQAQAQAQSQGSMAPRTTIQTNVSAAQSPVSTIINRQVTPTTIIRQSGPTPASLAPTTTLQRPPFLQRSVVTAVPGVTTGAISQAAGTTVTSITMSKETMENVKKCKNFLSTLIKLASTGKQSTETAATVRQLVKDLLESKLEAEEFTSRLYEELNSSPQPYLVPFLKRSLPALRQLTPDATAFIQQSQLPQPSSASVSSTVATPTTVVLGSPGPRLGVPINRPQIQPSIVKQGQTHTLVLQHQQQRAIMRPPALTSLAVRNQASGRIVFGQPHMQLQPFPVRPDGANVTRQMSAAALTPFQKNKIKEAGGTFKDDDDINDVASMAGVNLSEESANILATNSGLVGVVMRSCKDEPFLSHPLLQRKILEIGKRFGVTDVGGEVVTFVSHAIQHRLQDLLEKVTYVAQQKVGPFKEEDNYEQTSDVRSQLKFFEQLDLLEKQKKEEQEREILLKAAKSRARQEDPEQLRLKQKAKEMQQQELAQLRQREANMTALAAIGPRKKKKILDSSSSAAAPEGSETGSSVSGGAGSSGSRPTRQRITRVNLRDLLFCLENERFTSRSHFLYKGFLKQV